MMSTFEILEELVSLEEAARLIGVTAHALQVAAGRRTLRARRMGPPNRGLWVTTREEVARYHAENHERRRRR